MVQSVQVGNAHGFWGDRPDAAAQLLAHVPKLDFLTLDYLAEVSLSIMAWQQSRDRAAGFARDFVDVVRSLAPYWKSGGKCRVISNAGGLNPHACALACKDVLASAGCRDVPIGVVSGDDVLETIKTNAQPPNDSFRNLDTAQSIQSILDRLVTANAYLGAAPIAQALNGGAQLVVTGRVADPSLTVAPCVHHFNWSWDDWDRIAGATVAGHVIECGAQVTGGISTNWLAVPHPDQMALPIVSVAEDGSCTVTKPSAMGGWVNEQTVKEQLLYEIGDPHNYLSPDATVSLLSLHVEDQGGDRVRITGARGRAAPSTFKVSATYRDGFRAQGLLTVYGRAAMRKANRMGEIVLQRVRQAGHVLRKTSVECLGAGACVPGVWSPDEDKTRETVLRVAVEADVQAAVDCFARELMPLITSGPQGTTGYAEGRPRVHPVFRYWPCLIDRQSVTPIVEII